MNIVLILLVYVPLLVHCQATDSDSSNPECKDLKNLAKQAAKTVKLIPNSSLSCKPNKNCTGLICNGKLRGKHFDGTIILEGCKEPVRMVIVRHNKRLIVRDGYMKNVMTTPFNVWALVNMKKTGETVSVTMTVKVCLTTKTCIPYKILDHQKIRVHCKNSGTTMLPSVPFGNPTSSPMAAKSYKNPECKGLQNTKKQVENRFNLFAPIYPGSKISCHPADNCNDLKCAGVFNEDHFNATATIDYCEHPVKLRLQVSVPNKKLDNDYRLKDGDEVLLAGIIKIKIHLKRIGNIIYLSASVPIAIHDIDLVRNMSITVDPSHCPGYHSPSNSPQNSKCLKMSDPDCQEHEGSGDGKSLSTGAIVGVVLAAIVLFVVLFAIIAWNVRGRRRRIARYNDLAMTDDGNPLFVDSDPAFT